MDPSLYCRAGRVRNAVGLILLWQIPIDIFSQDFCPDSLSLPALQRTYGVHLTPSPLWVAIRSTAGVEHLFLSHRFLHGDACSL